MKYHISSTSTIWCKAYFDHDEIKSTQIGRKTRCKSLDRWIKTHMIWVMCILDVAAIW